MSVSSRIGKPAQARLHRGPDYELLKLVKELEWLRTLAHVSPVGIFRVNVDGLFTYVNDRWSELSGYRADAAIGAEWSLALHPEDRPGLLTEWERCLRERISFRMEHRFLQPNGRAVWALTQVAREVDGNGLPTGYTGTSTDITELRRMREELEQSHAALEVRMEHRTAELQRVARIVETIDDAVVSADLTGRVLSWNCGAEAIFGYTAAEMIGQPVLSLAPPEKQEEATSFEAHIRGGGEVHRMETIGVTKAGELRDLAISGFALRDGGGAIIGTWAIMRDITVRKQTEAALRASEAKYRRLHETMRDAFVQVGMDGRILDFNSAYEELLGYGPDELRSQTSLELTLPEWHAQDEKIAKEQVLPLGYSEVHEKEYRRKDGTVVPVELRSFLIRDDAGQPVGTWAIVRDVTERTRVREALRESERRLRLALDNGQHGLWDWDIVNGGEYLDERWYAIHGYAFEERPPTCKLWAETLHPEDRPRVLAALDRHLASNTEAFDVDYRARTKSGDWIWINSRGRVHQRDAAGRPLRMMGTICDITERKRVEHQLQQLSWRLLRIQDEERRRIARELHDSTAQALAALAMNLSALAREGDPLPEARRRKLLNSSIELAEQAAGELRTTSYLLHPPLLEERGLSAALGWLVAGFSERSGIEVRLQVARAIERLPLEVETALFRIVQESLHNAHRHSGSPTVEIQLTRDSSGITLAIRDQGSGPPPQLGATIGVGIAGMNERMLQLGGTLTIAPNHPGTAVIARVPLAS